MNIINDLSSLNPLRVGSITHNFNSDYNNQPRQNQPIQKTVPKELAAFADAMHMMAKPNPEKPKLNTYVPPQNRHFIFEDQQHTKNLRGSA